ncbi:alanine--tRNA ligase [Pleionea litopenaei]|uniref:Alanine--tRNA ligase n=1 Tax=Pleionea litopenaei TaxID=3070815 RepID=A0AA51X8D7_9GAMM|nr:alanine--tRNA ligase [Pleionea sp. HL-JVS1]WMS89272.1 alanine--tRNA ligase [Pleionea sp. HL-JVS1]
MSSNEIREAFLGYFEQRAHRRVASASLIPANDPTLLFTNAGMVPFKDCFLGTDKRDYKRATSSQRCVRAGGKHNDLDNVGYTARHHTFFEMLGNFSFGDYFKQEAIEFAWDFLTKELQLPAEKLWVTVYKDDQEAEDIWFNKIGIDQTRFSRLGEKDNYWSMGDTGPCGPCSEIFYDHGEDVAGGPPGSPEEDGDRYIEIWNLVFMQFNRKKDGTMEPLPTPSVDTGMGLERIAAVMQNVHSNYEIDLFDDLIKSIADILKVTDHNNKSLRVIADHIRSTAFLIIDGVVPGNEGRGYVLRRIMRRAIRHGHKLGAQEAFFYKVVAALAQQMGGAYPELKEKLSVIEQTILREEEQFARTLDNGMKILEQDLENLKGTQISGETVFKLYDTYGFPVDLTADIAREKELTIDESGFEKLMAEQKKQSQAAGQFGKDYNDNLDIDLTTEFVGYSALENSAEIAGLYLDDNPVNTLAEGNKGLLLTQTTCFYAESGGQAGDQGEISTATGTARVLDTVKVNNAFAHQVEVVSGSIQAGQEAQFTVDTAKRSATAKHHSATHLIHAALREILGEHVVQKGSLVDEHRLRFDFSHPEAMTAEQLEAVERRVNEEIIKNHSVTAEIMTMDQAKSHGAMALFGEKYGDEVRVLTMGPFSVELCGGTHVDKTGDIGFFKIVQEQGIASGVRRVEAVAGLVALDYVQKQQNMLNTLSAKLRAEPAKLEEKVDALINRGKELEKSLIQLQSKLAANQGSELVNEAVEVKGIKLIAKKLEGVEVKSLRDLLDQLKNKLQSGVVVLGVENDGKANLIVGVTKDLTQSIKAGDIVKQLAEQVGGKGGGRPDMAQAGGSNPENLDKAIASAEGLVAELL